jgi:serine/threonine protein phosphatase PrpC
VLEEACAAMIALAMERGGTDNITVIVIREKDS